MGAGEDRFSTSKRNSRLTFLRRLDELVSGLTGIYASFTDSNANVLEDATVLEDAYRALSDDDRVSIHREWDRVVALVRDTNATIEAWQDLQDILHDRLATREPTEGSALSADADNRKSADTRNQAAFSPALRDLLDSVLEPHNTQEVVESAVKGSDDRARWHWTVFAILVVVMLLAISGVVLYVSRDEVSEEIPGTDQRAVCDPIEVQVRTTATKYNHFDNYTMFVRESELPVVLSVEDGSVVMTKMESPRQCDLRP